MEQKNKLKIKVNSLNVFDGGGNYVSCSRVYYAYFEEIPSIKEIRGIDFNKAKKWVEKKFNGQICNVHIRETFDVKLKHPQNKNVLYILKNKILIDIEHGTIVILYTQESEEMIKGLIEEVSKEAKLLNKRSHSSYRFLLDNVD